jgi:hypothetical protein
MYIPSSKSGAGKPIGFQRWVKAANVRAIARKKSLCEIILRKKIGYEYKPKQTL